MDIINRFSSFEIIFIIIILMSFLYHVYDNRNKK